MIKCNCDECKIKVCESVEYPYHKCTMLTPYNKELHKDKKCCHPYAKSIGSTCDGAGDQFKCPICFTEWTDWYDD